MDKLYFLNEDYIRKVAEFSGLREEHTAAILKSGQVVIGDEKLIEICLKWIKEIFSQPDMFSEVELESWSIPDCAPLMPVVALYSNFDKLRAYYKEKGIDEENLSDLLYDVGRNLDECMERNGSYIIEETIFQWTAKHFTARLFQLGKLQFEALRFHEDNDLLRNGDYILNVHIPSGGRMPYNDVCVSYKRAVELFEKLYPDVKFKGFICESWMLSPQLPAILDKSSNLVLFLSDYKLFGTSDDEEFYNYIFIEKPDDLKKLSESTSLQRAIKTHLLSGGKILSGRGFIPLSDIV